MPLRETGTEELWEREEEEEEKEAPEKEMRRGRNPFLGLLQEAFNLPLARRI